MILLRISLRILIGFYKDFTNFYGFVKKMVQKNQYTYNVPPGPSDYIYNEARRAEFDGVGGLVDGVSNGSFLFLHTLWVYRTCIGLLIYMFKICHQLCYGFESFMSSWGSGSKISNLQQVGDVSFFRSKSSLFFSPPLGRPFLRKNTNFLFFCIKDFTKDFTNDFVGRLF